MRDQVVFFGVGFLGNRAEAGGYEDVLALADQVCVIDHGQVTREVNLRTGEHRDRAWQVLAPELPRRADDAQGRAVRALLGVPGAGGAA